MVMQHPLIEGILKEHRSDLDVDYDKYRNHVYRVFNFTLLLHEAGERETAALAVASAYHDIGIWTAGTFDYLKPSVALAKAHIETKCREVSIKIVEDIILNHHKIRPFKVCKLTEAFRKADMIDLSLGIITYGVSGKDISAIYDVFPGEWFHTFILAEIVKSALKNPLNPLPIMKW
jgi:hypothetical protein